MQSKKYISSYDSGKAEARSPEAGTDRAGDRLLRLLPPWLSNRKVRITRTGIGFLGLIVALAIAAFNTGNNLLYLILAMILAALPASFLLSEYMIAELRASREYPETVTAGQEFLVIYRLRNGNRLVPSVGVRVEERLGAAEIRAFQVYARPGRETVIKTRATVEARGRHRFQGLALSTAAPFGWFRKTRAAELGGTLVALPRAEAADADLDLLAATGAERPRSRRGPGDELFGFRRYVAGDAVKDIHWKTTARMGEPMVREREAEEERRLRIELRLGGRRPPRPDPVREEAVRRAAGLAEAALDRGFLVRVENEGRGVDFGAGPGQLQDLLLFLALFDEPGEPPAAVLEPTATEALILP